MTTAFQVKKQNQSHKRVRVAAYNTDNTGKPVGEPWRVAELGPGEETGIHDFYVTGSSVTVISETD